MNNEDAYEEMGVNLKVSLNEEESGFVYVELCEDGKSMKFELPGCRLVENNGYDDDEVTKMKEYVDNEQDSFFAMGESMRLQNKV